MTELATTPSKADMKRYQTLLKDIHNDIESIDLALRRVTKNLKTIHDRRLYFCGGYSSFSEFCAKELGKSRIHAYRLLQAHEVMQNLLESGVIESDLPPTERLCREVRRIKDPGEQTRIWKVVTRIGKERGRKVEAEDVKAEANKSNHPSLVQRQQMELVKTFEGQERALHVGFSFETMDPPFRKRILAALQRMAERIQELILTLESEALK